MPAARAKAAEASFPTLVADGNVFLSMRRTHANGGSKSAADGNGCGGWSGVVADADAVAGCLEVGVVVDLRADAGSVVAAAESMAVGEVALAVGELMVLGFAVRTLMIVKQIWISHFCCTVYTVRTIDSTVLLGIQFIRSS